METSIEMSGFLPSSDLALGVGTFEVQLVSELPEARSKYGETVTSEEYSPIPTWFTAATLKAYMRRECLLRLCAVYVVVFSPSSVPVYCRKIPE